jgi:copper chaperone CopZ
MKFSSIVFIIFTALVFSCSAPETTKDTISSENAKTVSLSIKGMVCNGCAESITEAINETPGVISGKVSLEDSTATITFDSSLVNTDLLLSAVEKTGYKAIPQP